MAQLPQEPHPVEMNGRYFRMATDANNEDIEKWAHSISQGAEFKLTHIRTSLSGLHFTLQQIIHGMPVWHGGMKININFKGELISLFDYSISAPIPSFNPDNANCWVKFENHFEACYADTLRDQIIFYNPNTQSQIFTYDLARPSGKDTLLKAMVFAPDPLSTANKNYGGSYQDFSDADSAVLNNERVQVLLRLDTMGAGVRLQNQYVRIMPLGGIRAFDTILPIPIPEIKRSNPNFESLNILYHIDRVQQGIKQFGFTDLLNQRIDVDPHATPGDQSMFTFSNGLPVLKFGDGGVDDAEDADVIVHEYHHAILEDASPGSYNGAEKIAIDEGSCDYFAKTWNVPLDSFHADKVFPWDGHNPFFAGRTIITNKVYPTDMTGTVHRNGEIWSSAIWELRGIIGKEKTDRLLYQTQYLAAPFISMRTMATLFLQADSLLYQHQNRWRICEVFSKKGLIPQCGLAVTELPVTQTNCNLNSDATIIRTSFWLLSNVEGKIIKTGKGIVTFNELPPGIYILKSDEGTCLIRHLP